MYEIATIQSPDKAVELTAGAKKNEADSREIQTKAQELEHEVEAKTHEAESHEQRHHVLTLAVTLLHVSIAIATISIITKGSRWPWYAALVLGLGGFITTALAYTKFAH